jgi:Leucine-rich repeat (LRR) protein
MPTHFGFLTRLRTLDVGQNNLTGTIPIELGRLDMLETLLLRSNKFQGANTELGRLTNLRALRFDDNLKRGSIATELGNLVALTQLDLANPHLSGTIPTELGQLTRLLLLDLRFMNLSGTLPSELGNMASLSELGVSWDASRRLSHI